MAKRNLPAKQYHQLIRQVQMSTKPNCGRIPPLENGNDEEGRTIVVTNDMEKAELLADHFQLKMELPEAAGEWIDQVEPTTTLNTIKCSKSDLADQLKSLKLGKAPGPSGIGPKPLKMLADWIAAPLLTLWEKMQREGIWHSK